MAVVCCLVGCTTTVIGFTAVAPRAGPATPLGSVPAVRVRVLQLNLCGSGFAACYTGRSVAEAASLIRAEAPDLVTLNEVCAGDVSMMQRALADVVPGGAVTSAFRAARDARTGEAFRCRAGRQYGIGLVARWSAVPGSVPGGGIYPIQDRRSPEGRAWLCLDVAATPAVSACTTHLTHTAREVAGAQCRYLFETVMPQRRARDGELPVVVGGDLNLGSGGGPDLSSCLPAGSALADDGGQQHVVATPEFVVESSRAIEMHETTDHPALLVTLDLPEHRGSERVRLTCAGGGHRPTATPSRSVPATRPARRA